MSSYVDAQEARPSSVLCLSPLRCDFVFRGNEPKKDATQLDFLNLCKDPNNSTIPLSQGCITLYHHSHLSNGAQCAIAPHCSCPPYLGQSSLARFPHLFGHYFLARAGLD